MMFLAACSFFAANPMTICEALVDEGVAVGCESKSPTVFGTERVRFELAGSGSHGMVYVFKNAAEFERGVEIAARMDIEFGKHDAAPHHFLSESNFVEIMLVHGANEEAQAKARALAESL